MDRRTGLALLIYLAVALLFAVWLHADSQTAFTIHAIPPIKRVAYFAPDYSRVTFTGAPIEVCVEMPEDHARTWCLPISELQIMLRERYKTP